MYAPAEIASSSRWRASGAHEILPSYEPGGDVHGMPGLRIWQRTKNGIEIHQSGRATSAWLTGLPASAWKRVEAEALDIILAELAWWPLWKGPVTRGSVGDLQS